MLQSFEIRSARRQYASPATAFRMKPYLCCVIAGGVVEKVYLSQIFQIFHRAAPLELFRARHGIGACEGHWFAATEAASGANPIREWELPSHLLFPITYREEAEMNNPNPVTICSLKTIRGTRA